MCFQCDNPELSYADDLDTVIMPLVRRNGWAVQGVEGRQPFAYTVGLTDCGLPELVVTGLPAAPAAGLLNDVARQVLHEDVLSCQRLPSTQGELQLLAVERPQEHLLTATALYGDDVRGTQLVWPDDRGRYPWQVGWRSRSSGQRLLGRGPTSGQCR